MEYIEGFGMLVFGPIFILIFLGIARDCWRDREYLPFAINGGIALIAIYILFKFIVEA